MDARVETGGEGGRSLQLTVERRPDAVTLLLSGELDASTGPTLRDELVRLIDSAIPSLELDLADLDFIDSVGLSVLVAGHHRAKSENVPYRLVNVAPGCRRILEITRLDAILNVA